MVVDSSEEIKDFTIVCSRISNSVSGDYWKLQRTSDSDSSLIPPFLLPFIVTLQFDINIFAAEDVGQPFDRLISSILSAMNERGSQWSFVASSKAYEVGAILLQLILGRSAFLLCRFAHFELCYELTKILIACS